jgi:hypothetical protein
MKALLANYEQSLPRWLKEAVSERALQETSSAWMLSSLHSIALPRGERIAPGDKSRKVHLIKRFDRLGRMKGCYVCHANPSPISRSITNIFNDLPGVIVMKIALA